MGEIRTMLKLENDRMVDTGAVMLLLPQDIVEMLGLEIIDKIKVKHRV